MESNLARQNLQTLFKGKRPPGEISTKEAKARLRAADPGLDISRSLKHLGSGEVKEAVLSLAVEVTASLTIFSIQPLMTTLVHGLLTENRHRRQKQKKE
jgi:hypothetical protein